MNEDDPLRASASTKKPRRAGDKLARELGEKLGIEVAVVRPTQVYGPGDTRLLKLFKMANKDKPLIIGSGKGGYHLVYHR